MKEELSPSERAATEGKKAYQKPVLSQVRLLASGAVLGTCKINAGTKSTCEAAGDLKCGGGTTPRS